MILTENAAKELKNIMVRDGLSPQETAIRIGVKAGGCSGFTYTLDFDENKTRKFDITYQTLCDLVLLVDKKSHLYVKGTIIDWSYNLNDRGLKFNNPKAKTTCGCKTSFMIDIPQQQNAPTWMMTN